MAEQQKRYTNFELRVLRLSFTQLQLIKYELEDPWNNTDLLELNPDRATGTHGVRFT
mgnify:CR=1 FL=1